MTYCPGCLRDFETGETGCKSCGACDGCSPAPLGRVDGLCWSCGGDPPLEVVVAQIKEACGG